MLVLSQYWCSVFWFSPPLVIILVLIFLQLFSVIAMFVSHAISFVFFFFYTANNNVVDAQDTFPSPTCCQSHPPRHPQTGANLCPRGKDTNAPGNPCSDWCHKCHDRGHCKVEGSMKCHCQCWKTLIYDSVLDVGSFRRIHRRIIWEYLL